MPHMDSLKQTLEVVELHPTFGAEVLGVDFSKPMPEETFEEIRAALAKYGVCIFRNTGLDDKTHVEFASRFGELDDIKPYLAFGRKNRLAYDELFDVSNLDDDGNLLPLNTKRAHMNKGNTIFHVDSSFNPRRAGYSLLRASEIPPPGTGGNTEFTDSRQAFEDLPDVMKEELTSRDYVACHSLWQSRKLASPDAFPDVDPRDFYMSRHKLIQKHEPSGRMNLYIAAHVHHIEGLSAPESNTLIAKLFAHATQPRNVLSVQWENNGDLVIWDNTCVLHRSVPGEFNGKYRRDMRRATVHDGSVHSWGLNEHSDVRQGLP